MSVGWQLLIVAAFAGSVGLSELISRYKSDPKYILSHSVAAWLYILVNSLAGIGALLLIRAFGWFADSPNVDLWRALIAGFSAIAFFRSSLFVTKIGDTTVGVGPSLVLGALLDACDREVDRQSAQRISDVISGDKLVGLDASQIMFALPVLCLALMQNFPPGDQALLGAELAKLRTDTSLSERAKMNAVVIQLSKALGTDVVTKVLEVARPIFELQPPAVAAPLPAATAVIAETKRRLSESQSADPEDTSG